jgi:hypothetical protein
VRWDAVIRGHTHIQSVGCAPPSSREREVCYYCFFLLSGADIPTQSSMDSVRVVRGGCIVSTGWWVDTACVSVDICADV